MVFLFRLWSTLAGAITLILIPVFLSPFEQGYYFTFASLLALHVFFELGMSQVIVQVVAHEAAKINLDNFGKYDGDEEAIARLAQLKHVLSRWYFIVSLVFAISVSVFGLLFLNSGELSLNMWAPQWLIMVIFFAINTYMSWKLSLLEGFARVSHVAKIKLINSTIGYVLMWFFFFFGGGLWAIISVPITSVFFTFAWLRYGQVKTIVNISSDQLPLNPINWRKDIFPFQWRIALSWLSGYFTFQLFTPLAFRYFGSIEAGKLGITISLFGAIGTIGYSVISAKIPNFTMMLASQSHTSLVKLFKKLVKISLVFTALMSVSAIFLLSLLTKYDQELGARFADINIMWALAITTIVNCYIFSAATFMRAHREEPMLNLSIVSAFLTSIVLWYQAQYSIIYMILGYAIICIFVALPWTYFKLNGYMKRYSS